MKLLMVGDIHLAKGPPLRRTGTYMHDILAKLDATVEIAKDQEVDAVVLLGDIYHHHMANKVPHSLTKAVSVRARSYGVPVYVVPGNHDMYAGDLQGVYVSQPIALLDELPNVTVLGWEPVTISEDVTLYPVPGVPHLPIEVYQEKFPGPVSASGSSFNLFAVHQSIARDGQGSLPFSHVGAEEFAAAIPWADLVAYGHLHEDYGWYSVDGVTFANFGSICRGTISESDLKKEPKVYVLTIEGGQADFELFPLPHRPAEEVFKMEEYLSEKAKKRDIEDYVAQIQRVSVQTFSVDTVIGSLGNRSDVEESVRDYSIDCINKVRG